MIRNAVSDVLVAVYGSGWPWADSFKKSLPNPSCGYNQQKDLLRVRQVANTTGKVIPELPFVFWQQMLTRRHDTRLRKPGRRPADTRTGDSLTSRFPHYRIRAIRTGRGKCALRVCLTRCLLLVRNRLGKIPSRDFSTSFACSLELCLLEEVCPRGIKHILVLYALYLRALTGFVREEWNGASWLCECSRRGS